MTENGKTAPQDAAGAALQSARAAFEAGEQLFLSRQYDAAAAKLEEAIGLFPEGAEGQTAALTRMGHLRMLQNRHADARPFLEKAIALSCEPQHEIESRFMLGKTLAHLGQHKEAFDEYRIIMAFLIEKRAEAKKDPQFQRSLALSEAAVFHSMGISAAYLGDDESAARLLEQAILGDPQNPQYRKDIAPLLPALRTANDKDRAAHYVRFAQGLANEFGIHAESVSAKLTREALLFWPDSKEIEQVADSFVVKDSESPASPLDPQQTEKIVRAFNYVGCDIAARFRDFDMADVLWEESLRLAPDHPLTNFYHALALIDQDKYSESEAVLMGLMEYLETNDVFEDMQRNESLKKDVEGLSGIVCSRLGRHEAAYLMLKKAARPPVIFEDVLRPLYLNALGKTVHALGGPTTEAIAALALAVMETPEKARQEEFRADLKEAGSASLKPESVPGPTMI